MPSSLLTIPFFDLTFLPLRVHHLCNDCHCQRRWKQTWGPTWWICNNGIKKLPASPRIVGYIKCTEINNPGCDSILSGSTKNACWFPWSRAMLQNMFQVGRNIVTNPFPSFVSRLCQTQIQVHQSRRRMQSIDRISMRENGEPHICHTPSAHEWIIYPFSRRRLTLSLLISDLTEWIHTRVWLAINSEISASMLVLPK